MDVNTNNRSQNTVGRTRFFDLCPKGYGELMTEALYGFLEVHYFFF